MARFTLFDRSAKLATFKFWLVFNGRSGDMRLTRGEPDCASGERAMKLEVKLPFALFETPTLKAVIDVAAVGPNIPPIDLTAASDALKGALGVDIDLKIIPPEPLDEGP